MRLLTLTSASQDGHPLSALATPHELTSDGAGGAALVLTSVGPEADGWYQCTAFNAAGSATTRARVAVDVPREEPRPPQPPKLDLPRGRVIEPE